jgi:hypothetical protein
MPQIGGKNAKKSSKTKSSSTSKRHFTVVIGTKEHGLYCSSSPSSAARKAVSKLCGKEKGKKVEFCLREITQGSKKKTYGPYLGHIEILAKPIQLKGRLVERTPVARLKPKSSAKKGGMRGGEGNNLNQILLRMHRGELREKVWRVLKNFENQEKKFLNGLTNREKEFMSDYKQMLNPAYAMSGQSPHFLMKKYTDIYNKRKSELKNYVNEKLKK